MASKGQLFCVTIQVNSFLGKSFFPSQPSRSDGVPLFPWPNGISCASASPGCHGAVYFPSLSLAFNVINPAPVVCMVLEGGWEGGGTSLACPSPGLSTPLLAPLSVERDRLGFLGVDKRTNGWDVLRVSENVEYMFSIQWSISRPPLRLVKFTLSLIWDDYLGKCSPQLF